MRIVASSLALIPMLTSARRGVLLELTDDEGRVGQGEATPYPGFSLDDAASCERALDRARSRLGVIDDEGPAEDVVASAVAAALDPDRGGPTPAARFALETALLDLIAQRRGASIASILRADRPAFQVALNGLLVASPDAGALVERAHELITRGLSTLKIKLRSPDASAFARDLEALTILRREIPPSIEIRLDANGAFTLDEAPRRLAALAELSPSFVEQPVPAADLPRLGRCAVPWAADESLLIDDHAARLLDADGCSAFILKPSALGLLRARQLALRAFERGLGVVVTHFFDGPVAFAAARELALGLPRSPLACGLDLHAEIAAWSGALDRFIGASSVILPSVSPGLGLRWRPPPARRGTS